MVGIAPMIRALEQVPVEVRLGAHQWHRESDLAVLFVPFDPGTAGPNKLSGSHWSKRDDRTQVAHLAALWGWQQAGEPQLAAPVRVDVLVFRGRQMDDDNLWNGLKGVRDGLFKGRCLPDDARVYCGEVRQVVGPQWAAAKAWCVLLVRPMEG